MYISGCSKDNSRLFWENFWKRKKESSFASWSKRRVLSVLDSFPDLRGLDILEAGCGTGFFSSYFISRGAGVYCLDYSEKALSLAESVTLSRARRYIKADILRADDLLSIGKKFDFIFTDGLLEHYSSLEQDLIINNLSNIKKKNALMLNFVPNKFSLWSLVRPFIMDIKEEPFAMKPLLELHRRNGLDVISCGGINVLPFRFSPEILAKKFGMLLYCVSK